MLTPSLEPDTDRLSALYRYGIVDSEPDAFLQAVAAKLAGAFGDMTVQIVLVDDHRLWTAATAGQQLEERGQAGYSRGSGDRAVRTPRHRQRLR